MEVGAERIELPGGRLVDDFLWIKTRDFAMVVAVTPDGRVILERSYKHGPRSVALSLPAGYIEAGETPDQTARRELREETGYTSEEWRRLGSFTVDGNYGVCTAHLFLAQGAIQSDAAGGHGHDDLEEIEVLSLPLSDALAAVARGDVVQLSSAAAIALAAAALG
jgi:ADP-ribose pyrophosphatase